MNLLKKGPEARITRAQLWRVKNGVQNSGLSGKSGVNQGIDKIKQRDRKEK
jgi:hypothetical protein